MLAVFVRRATTRYLSYRGEAAPWRVRGDKITLVIVSWFSVQTYGFYFSVQDATTGLAFTEAGLDSDAGGAAQRRWGSFAAPRTAVQTSGKLQRPQLFFLDPHPPVSLPPPSVAFKRLKHVAVEPQGPPSPVHPRCLAPPNLPRPVRCELIMPTTQQDEAPHQASRR